MPAWLRLALAQLRSAPLRALLSVLAVAVGVATLITAEVVSRATTSQIDASAEAITGFMSEQLNVGLTVVGLVVTAGAGFLTFNVFSLAVSQRRPDFGRLRSLGMTPGQLTAMIVAEAGLVGVAGTAAGLAAGPLLGRGLIELVQRSSEMFNRFGAISPSPERMALAAVLGIAAAGLGSWGPARRAARVSPLTALRPPAADALGKPSIRNAAIAGLGSASLWAYLALDPPGAWIGPSQASSLSVLFGAIWLGLLLLMLPWLADLGSRTLRRPLAALLGPAGRLAADGPRRSRSQAGLTIVSLAVGVGMIVGVAGYMTFWFDELFFRLSDTAIRKNPGLGYFPIDVGAGLEAYTGLTSLALPEGLRPEVEAIVGDQAVLVDAYFVLIPELSFLGERYFSYVLDPRAVRESGSLFFSFAQGNWDRALEIADRGCALLLTPTVAERNNVGLEGTIRIESPAGALPCTVAGIGPTFVGASIVSLQGVEAFGLTSPVGLTLFFPSATVRDGLLPALQAAADRNPGAWLIDLRFLVDLQREGMKSVRVVMDGMLVLAVLSAGLGVANTMAIGLHERRREVGLLRSAGATRRQVQTVFIAEGALLGVLGAGFGLAAGGGVVLIYTAVSAGSPMGFPDFPVWPAALNTLREALRHGALALLATPVLTGWIAWLSTRRALRGTVVESLAEAAHAG